jgi:hypothetical protein
LPITPTIGARAKTIHYKTAKLIPSGVYKFQIGFAFIARLAEVVNQDEMVPCGRRNKNRLPLEPLKSADKMKIGGDCVRNRRFADDYESPHPGYDFRDCH